MKRIITGLTAALALAFVGSARADDTQTTQPKTKTEKKTTKDPKSAGSATDSSTYSKDLDKDLSGTKSEKKAPSMDDRSATPEKDSSGKVVTPDTK